VATVSWPAQAWPAPLRRRRGEDGLRLARQPRLAPPWRVRGREHARPPPGSGAAGPGWERDESARGRARSRPGEGGRGVYVTSRYPASRTPSSCARCWLYGRRTDVETSRCAGPTRANYWRPRTVKRPSDLAHPALDRRAFVGAHLRAAGWHPVAYGRALAEASVGPPGGKDCLAVVLLCRGHLPLDHADKAEARHLHAHMANVAADVCWLACSFGRMAQPAWLAWSFTMHGPTELYSTERFNWPQVERPTASSA